MCVIVCGQAVLRQVCSASVGRQRGKIILVRGMMTARVCRGSLLKIQGITKSGAPCDSAVQFLRNWRGFLAAGGSCRAQSTATLRAQEWGGGGRKQKAARNALSCCPHIRSTSASLRSFLSTTQNVREDPTSKSLSAQEDPFDTITDNIPEKPVTAAEGASYMVVIAAGLAVAGAAGYAVFKELVFQPREYKVFGRALDRVKNDVKVTSRLGTPITGYGDESTNRAARQRVRHKVYKDEDGIEHIQVQFLIRGPHGAGTVHCEMFYDEESKDWKFTYLIVDITSPPPAKRFMLESYIPI